MTFPDNCKYTKDHEWIRLDADGKTAVVGITEFAQQELGEITFVEVDSIEKKVAAGQVFGTLEAVKTTADLFMPVTGTVKSLNEKLDSNPELVNSDPYGEGWIVIIEIDDTTELDSLMDAKAYAEIAG